MSIEYLTVNQYAELMSMNPRAVRAMCEKGSIDCKKVGGRWRIAHEPGAPQLERSLEEILNRLKVIESKQNTLFALVGDLCGASS